MQSMYSDLAAVSQLEQRRREALEKEATDDMDVLMLKHRCSVATWLDVKLCMQAALAFGE